MDIKCTPVIIIRFLGTTPISSSIGTTLISIINQLDLLYFDKKDIDDDLNEFRDLDGNQLNKLLIKRLEIIEKKFVDARIFIFIDAIDQLNTKDLNLNWFLKEYPLNTKVISCEQ